MSPNQIVNLIERKRKGLKVISIYDYKDDYLVTYMVNGSTLMDPFYLVTKDGKSIKSFNPSSDPFEFSDVLRDKSPLYILGK